jgi:UDP-N-acetylglucosamine--N-acetylmuramyl-(pentapeptide) pyrophosphoryl-undecaprenol N-acetylglucosamine transferase
VYELVSILFFSGCLLQGAYLLPHTIMIMAGGPGGHVFPGLAVADYMRANGWQIVWLGTQTGMEATLVPQYGFPIELICFSGVRGKALLDQLLLPWRLLRAFWQSLRVLQRVRPDVVLGMGGYPALPGGLMTSVLGKPLLIHEQNTIAGLTNRVLARVADCVLLGFPGAISGCNGKIQVTGNPIRSEIAQLPPPEARYAGRTGKLRVLVIGGSLGAHRLNTILPQTLSMIPEEERPLVMHQAGKSHLAALEKSYADHGVTGNLVAFIEDMSVQYSDCDLVICRAGALTVSELAAAGVASILVPYPHAVDDHQTINARFLADHEAAILWPQSELTAASLAEWLTACTREQLQVMAANARALAAPDATRMVAEVCRSMIGAAK